MHWWDIWRFWVAQSLISPSSDYQKEPGGEVRHKKLLSAQPFWGIISLFVVMTYHLRFVISEAKNQAVMLFSHYSGTFIRSKICTSSSIWAIGRLVPSYCQLCILPNDAIVMAVDKPSGHERSFTRRQSSIEPIKGHCLAMIWWSDYRSEQ